ncbi:formate dehydrogenase subunit delta [Methyloceanibacter sp.]|uniref:formate dehydrogenase subunit delta n=1 Tax=Methyloceanibacter sp. TaxID=1965321 RepID=UPI002D1FBB72|nr:formate dehydrogenase subunit delta [Methyloceanibacter sp.]
MVPGIADHIGTFWEPRMRTAIFASMDRGGAGLDPLVKEAMDSLKSSLREASESGSLWRTECRHGPPM